MSIVRQDIELSRLGAHVKPNNGDRPKVDPQLVLLQTLDASIKELTKAVREIETAKIDLGPVASALRSVLTQVVELSKPKEEKAREKKEFVFDVKRDGGRIVQVIAREK